jgi:glycosyltransferase involved in cell wall biosynthesis
MEDWPTVSVVLPVRNEVATVEGAIRSVLAQEYPRPFEVVVADGMSGDGTRETLEKLSADEPRLLVVDNPSGITPSALNAAIRASSGEVVVRCDGHGALPSGYIRRAVEIMIETGADNVGGVQAATGRGFVQRSIAMAMSSRFGVGDARFHVGGAPGPVDTVFLGVFRRAALDRVGMFDEHLARNQDAELNHRIIATGGTVYFHPDLRVTYYPRASLRALWRQYFASGAWKRETFKRSPGSFRLRQAAPPTLVLGMVASTVVAFTPWRIAAAAVPAAYVAFLVAATWWTLARRRDVAALLLPGVLPTMHLGWGLGFLAGRARR